MPTGSHVRCALIMAFGIALAAAVPARAVTGTDTGIGAPLASSLSVPNWALAPAEHLDAFAAGPEGSLAPVQSPNPSGSAATMPPTASSTGLPSPLSAAARSLVLPGWGQLATGHKTQAAIFGTLELGTWVAYGVFQRQGNLRRDSYFDTARLYANIDLKDKSDEIEKLVGQFETNEVYNQYVVMREAAYFYEDPVEREQYIASRTIGGEDAWAWTSFEAFEVYRAQRRSSELAYQRVEYVLSFAVINRLVSAVMAAKSAAAARSRAKELEDGVGAVETRPRPTAGLAWDLAPGRGLVPDARVAWVLRF